MGKRQIDLREAEIAQFRQVEAQTRDGDELRRPQAIRLYGSGVRLAEIMDLVGVGASSIRQWAMIYRAERIAGLRSKWQGNNANKLTAEQRGLVKSRLHQYRPVDLHLSEGMYWTVSDLRVAVEQWFGVVYRDETSYQRRLHQSGLSYQRTAKVYRSKPSAADEGQFEAELEKKTDFLQNHPDGEVIALGEMSLYSQATTTRVWSLKGETSLVWGSPQRDHTHFYGALNLRSGHEFALPSPEMSSQTTADFLRDLLVCYPTQPILLLWDRAHWHKGESVKALLAHNPRLNARSSRSARRSCTGSAAH
ncbi:MAG: IS630 family transposase [Anaerolineae bacterium]